MRSAARAAARLRSQRFPNGSSYVPVPVSNAAAAATSHACNNNDHTCAASLLTYSFSNVVCLCGFLPVLASAVGVAVAYSVVSHTHTHTHTHTHLFLSAQLLVIYSEYSDIGAGVFSPGSARPP
jgi:hypothetical protein